MVNACEGYSIGRRLSWQLFWQTLLGLGLLCTGIYAVTSMLFASKQNDSMATKAAVVQEIMRAGAMKGSEADVIEKLAYYAPRRGGTFVEISRLDGRVIYRDSGDATKLDGDDHARQTYFQTPLPNIEGGALKGRLVLDCREDFRMLAALALTLVAATFGGAAFVGAAAAWRVRRGLKPLRELARQTRAISSQRLDQRLALPEPAVELQPWIGQFNALMDRLERSYAQLEGFNADVAHELRTPLATLIGQTEVALSRERSAEALRDTLVSNLEELQRLAAMVNDMLFLSRADHGATARRGTPVSLADLAQQVVEFHEAAIDEAQLRVSVQGDARIAVDEPLFKRAVSNLLGNAVRFAEPRSHVVVHIAADMQDHVKVTVQNSGPAIEPQSLARLFDRFFRADTSRQDGQQHHGLGLAIVAAIARMHAGQPLAESANGTTRVGFTLAVS